MTDPDTYDRLVAQIHQLERLCGRQALQLDALQARIDMLMLEYCPDEMTPSQMANWEKHQVPSNVKA